MLGTLRAAREGLSLTRFRTRRVALLLAFLSYHRSREYTREELGEMLWPDQEEQAVRHNLRQALHSLRQALEPPPLPAGSILLTKHSRVFLDRLLTTSDVAEFERLVGRARGATQASEQSELCREAIELYRGELLPGFHEEWVLRERLKMEDLYVSCLRSMIEVSKRENRHDDAVLYLRKALAQEPLQEEWHTDLMEQYLKAGRPASALKHFRELRHLLKSQLGCEPSAQSRALAEMSRRAATISSGDDSGSDDAPTKPSPEEPHPVPALGSTGDATTIARLPIQTTRFFGRDGEIRQVRQAFTARETRLVSLLGPAGTGKTRLAIEVGRKLFEDQEWTVWFTSLAELSEASMLLDEIADVMHARQSNAPDLISQIAASVTTDSSLLILDNLEHILEEAVPIIARLAEQIPLLRILVTSRQSLNLTGEREFQVDPLPIPDVKALPPLPSREQLAALAEYPSVQVFIDRSQAIRADAQLTTSNAAAIAAICSKLEGIPLAIELAAGQTATIAPSQMLRHLDRRLTALSTRRRDATPRHRSLRAAIDYSFESLSPNLQRLFAALSTFRGGFTVESAFEVCYRWMGEDATTEPGRRELHPTERCLEAIVDLQERSLVRPEVQNDAPEPRFRMLESFRQYGEEHLPTDEQHALRCRHVEYLLHSFDDLPEHASSEEHTHQHLRIAAEHDNFVACIEFLFQSKDYETCVRLLGVMSKVWLHLGPRVIEREYIRQISILTRDKPIDPLVQIRLLRMVGTTFIRASDYAAAHRSMELALEVALGSADHEQIATCYAGLSTCAGFMGRMDECFELNTKALQYVSRTNHELVARIHLGLGAVHWSEGRLVEAEADYRFARDASALARGGEPDALVVCNLARTSLDLGRSDEAMSLVGDAIRICKRLGDPYTLSNCLYLVARYHWLKGDLTAALATNHQGLLTGQDSAFGFLSLVGVRNHALILARTSELESAATLLAATHSLASMHRTLDERDFSEARELCIASMKRPAFERAWAKGLGMSGEESFRVALQYK